MKLIVNYTTIKEALSQPISKHFWVECTDGSVETGNSQSYYSKNIFDEHLTFDISNNKVLANVSLNGSIKYLTIYRSSYRVDSIPGVWVHKDFSKTGPFFYTVEVDKEVYELPKVDWSLKTSFLDNLFPVTQLTDDEQVKITLISYAPISADGKKRLRGIVYGLYLENISHKNLTGSILLPRVTGSPEKRITIRDVFICLADSKEKGSEVPYYLAPGQGIWVPTVIAAPGESTLEEVDEKGSLYWLNATWTYFKRITGKLTMPGDSFTEEFLQRTIHQCIESVGMDSLGNIAGSNWGTYPTTAEIWMKDMYYSLLPLFMFESEFFKEGLIWFLKYSIRPKGNRFEGGVEHSLGNTLTPVIMAGLYYSSTGDKDFFLRNQRIKDKMLALLQLVISSRKGADIWLFPSIWISDGYSLGDFHTGSNIAAWYSFKSFARILDEVYREHETAKDYYAIAKKIKQAIEQHNIIDGHFGKQYIEGINVDKTIPCMGHDGEESDTTLMPLYGYLSYDNKAYKNYTRFALSKYNSFYVPDTRGLRWHTNLDTDGTFPGYITGFANVIDYETMNGEDGYMTQIRSLTDIDGSLWWWPYPGNGKHGSVLRNHIAGKSGWASGVFAGLFVSEILGVRYDGPTRTFSFRPFSPSSDFMWEGFRIGNSIFSVKHERLEDETLVMIENRNDHSIAANIEILLEGKKDIKAIYINNHNWEGSFIKGEFLDEPTIKISENLLPGDLKNIRVVY